jgi:hypothetical protein
MTSPGTDDAAKLAAVRDVLAAWPVEAAQLVDGPGKGECDDERQRRDHDPGAYPGGAARRSCSACCCSSRPSTRGRRFTPSLADHAERERAERGVARELPHVGPGSQVEPCAHRVSAVRLDPDRDGRHVDRVHSERGNAPVLHVRGTVRWTFDLEGVPVRAAASCRRPRGGSHRPYRRAGPRLRVGVAARGRAAGARLAIRAAGPVACRR